MINSGNVYKWLDIISGKFWNCKRLLTYNRPWNFVTGSRSVGKSTNIACFLLLDYIINKHKFLYMRRTKDETLLTCSSFFGSATKIISDKTPFKIYGFKYEKQKYWISLKLVDEQPEWEECGGILPLSLEHKYKSANLSDVFNVVYDEFIAKDSTQYLGTLSNPREYTKLISAYQTIDRGIDRPYRNETRFFFLGNTATIYNPLFLKMGIADYIVSGAKFIAPKNKLWILEMIESVEALADIQNSFAYQLSDDEERDYAYHNKGYDSETSFIAVPEVAYFDVNVILEGEDYGICHSSDYSYYIGKPNLKATAVKISLDVKGHNGIDAMMIDRMNDMPIMKVVASMFRQGRLYFNNPKTKNAFLKYLKFMPG